MCRTKAGNRLLNIRNFFNTEECNNVTLLLPCNKMVIIFSYHGCLFDTDLSKPVSYSHVVKMSLFFLSKKTKNNTFIIACDSRASASE